MKKTNVKMTGHLEEDGLEASDLVDLAQLLLLLTVGSFVSFSSWQKLFQSILNPEEMRSEKRGVQ